MSGIYFHIPFCKQKCNYCNFHFSTSSQLKDKMLTAMHQELELLSSSIHDTTLETIYFGGGTPSLLSPDEINKFFDHTFKLFPNINLKECTLEANPDDLNLSYLKQLKNTPINRLSIGIQSFRNVDLKFMNRAHNAQEAEFAVKSAQDCGFENLTIDLIYGIPNLSNEDWKNNLSKVKAFEIPHFSAYALTVEEGTALFHQILKKKTPPLDETQAAQQFEILMHEAEMMDFEHYEISNFANKGKYAVHNTNYWKGEKYLGIGPSAHSFNGKKRSWNIANNALYIASILDGKSLPKEEETLSHKDVFNEYIMTSLRTMWGCDLKKVEQEFDSNFQVHLHEKSQNWIKNEMMQVSDNNLRLTKKGKLFADKIASELFV